MTRHLVVGGCGFLGRHLVQALARRGEQVTVADLADFPLPEMAASSFIGDLTRASADAFDQMVAEIDVVHHFAWSTIPAVANADPLQDLVGNLSVTIGLLDALKRRGEGRMVFASSGGTVYGLLHQVPVPETHPLEPMTAYGISKMTAEKYLQLYRNLHGVDARAARISNPYGAGQNPARPQGAVSNFIHRALNGQQIEIWGDGTVTRDFVYVNDMVEGVLRLADAAFPEQRSLPVFNIGSGKGSSLNEILTALEQVLGRRLAVDLQQGRAFDVPVSILSIAKAATELDWAPRTGLVDGITRMVSDLNEDRKRLFSSR